MTQSVRRCIYYRSSIYSNTVVYAVQCESSMGEKRGKHISLCLRMKKIKSLGRAVARSIATSLTFKILNIAHLINTRQHILEMQCFLVGYRSSHLEGLPECVRAMLPSLFVPVSPVARLA